MAHRSPNAKTGIHSLPPELLLIIFELAFFDLRECKVSPEYDFSSFGSLETLEEPEMIQPKEYYTDPRDSANWNWHRENDMLSPTLFPYAPANVCKLWRDLLIIEPAFWTRIVIVVDSPATTADLVRSYFERTKDEPIHVWVTRSDKTVISDPRENERVKMITNCLRPHLKRCVSVSFNLLHRSSIVIAGDRLRGSAPLLRILVLNSRNTDSTADVAYLLLDAPELHMLELDAHSFASSVGRKLASVWLLRQRTSSSQLQLRLSRYQPGADTGVASEVQMSDVVATLDYMPDIELLSIRDVEFAEPGDVDFVDREIHTVYLEGLRGSAVSTFFRCLTTHASRTSIVRCDLDGEWNFPIQGESLYLHDLSDSAKLACAMRGWDGEILHVDECAGFTDEVVSAMVDPPSPQMTWLCVDNFAGEPLSFDAVERAAAAWVSSILPYGSLTLYIQQAGDVPDQALCAWFNDRVHDFDWRNDSPSMSGIVPEVRHAVDCYDFEHQGKNVSPRNY